MFISSGSFGLDLRRKVAFDKRTRRLNESLHASTASGHRVEKAFSKRSVHAVNCVSILMALNGTWLPLGLRNKVADECGCRACTGQDGLLRRGRPRRLVVMELFSKWRSMPSEGHLASVRCSGDKTTERPSERSSPHFWRTSNLPPSFTVGQSTLFGPREIIPEIEGFIMNIRCDAHKRYFAIRAISGEWFHASA